MKNTMKICSAAMAFSMLCNAVPAATVFAAEETTGEEEAVVMTATVKLEGDKATATGDNVTIDGKKITITASGAYEFSGTMADGQICVNVPDETVDAETVKLYFNGINLTGVSDAAVYVVNAENTSINLVEGTDNFLYDGETYSETEAVIHAKDDLTIKGDGSLRIEAAYHYGIQCNNDLKFNGGDVKVKTEAEDGVRGKSSVTVKDGKLDVNAEGDGIKSTKGDVVISGGRVKVKAGNDAIQGETSIQISEGRIRANGDRGLRCDEGKISVTGGEILATATDNQVENLESEQPCLLYSFSAENTKDLTFSLIAITEPESEVFSEKTDKKFSYAMISSPALRNGFSYRLEVDGNVVENANCVEIKEIMNQVEGAVIKTKDPLRFDINEDGKVEIADAILLSRYCAEEEVAIGDVGISRLNCNGDEYVNMEDVSYVLMFIARLID